MGSDPGYYINQILTSMLLARLACIIIPVWLVSACGTPAEPLVPLNLHPGNPHYFLFRKTCNAYRVYRTLRAVMNLDFDYIRYFDELAACKLNVTRTFSGIYVEPPGVFGITRNTLAPGTGRFICPWARSTEEGYPFGGNKFDLTKWDTDYFSRLKNFVEEAGKRNIVVELDLFSNFYDTLQWKLSR
jgi:hypothetical protein